MNWQDFEPPKVESFTKINKQQAIASCDSMLKRITADRNQKLEQQIKWKMEEDRRGFWERFRKRPEVHCTREQAIAELKQREDWQWTSYYTDIMLTYKHQEITCNRIKALANASVEDFIFITAHDLNSIT